jgi:hypothetical protein
MSPTDLQRRVRAISWYVVLCLGVLYHLRHPLLALERVASVTRECLVLETVVDMTATRGRRWPSTKHRAPWRSHQLVGPNVPALQAMLRSVGFVEVLVVTPQRSTAYRPARAPPPPAGQDALGPACRQDRAVCHAFR